METEPLDYYKVDAGLVIMIPFEMEHVNAYNAAVTILRGSRDTDADLTLEEVFTLIGTLSPGISLFGRKVHKTILAVYMSLGVAKSDVILQLQTNPPMLCHK